jgi:predicted Fe-Mo cluster-binding NifX family protein
MSEELKNMNKEKIAFTSTGGSMESLLSEQFGRCQYFIIVDQETGKFEAVSNLGEQMQSGAGPKAAELIHHHGANVVVTGHVGDKAEEVLKRVNIKIVSGYKGNIKVKDALSEYLSK